MNELFANRVFQSTFICWATAQTLKFLIELIWKRKANFRLLTTAGGMPSSHTAAVTSLRFLFQAADLMQIARREVPAAREKMVSKFFGWLDRGQRPPQGGNDRPADRAWVGPGPGPDG